MMMQYLYYGGTESMEIPTADILEVRLGRGGGGLRQGPRLLGLPFTPFTEVRCLFLSISLEE